MLITGHTGEHFFLSFPPLCSVYHRVGRHNLSYTCADALKVCTQTASCLPRGLLGGFCHLCLDASAESSYL